MFVLVLSNSGVAGLKLLGGPGLLFSFFPPPHATAYIFFFWSLPNYGGGGPGCFFPFFPSPRYVYILEFAKLLGGPGPPGPLNAATPLVTIEMHK